MQHRGELDRGRIRFERTGQTLVGERRVALPRAKQLAQMLVSSPPGDRELDVLELVQRSRQVVPVGDTGEALLWYKLGTPN